MNVLADIVVDMDQLTRLKRALALIEELRDADFLPEEFEEEADAILGS